MLNSKSRFLDIAKYFIVIFIPAALVVGVIVWGLSYADFKAREKILRAGESYSVKIHAETIADDFDIIVSDLLVQSTQTEFNRFADGKTSDALKLLTEEFLIFSKIKGIYDQVRFIDKDGMERVRVNYNDGSPYAVPARELQSKVRRYYFLDTMNMEPGGIYVSPFDLNKEYGVVEEPLKPVIRFATPVFSKDGQRLGVVVFNYLGERLFTEIERRFIDQAGHFILVNAEGYYLYNKESDDLWGFMFEGMVARPFERDYPDLSERMKQDDSAQVETDDGLFTFDTIYPLLESWASSTALGIVKRPTGAKNYKWILISHLSSEDLYSAIGSLKGRVIKFYLLAVIPLVVGLWFIARLQVNRRYLSRARDEALENVKALKGLIPICAYCKNVKDDQGYWKQVESYVADHSEAEFSHGICEECSKKVLDDARKDGYIPDEPKE